MRSKRTFAALIAVLLILPNVFTVFAVSAGDLDELPTLTSELVTEGERAGLYITLENPPPDLSMIMMDFSFGGLDYAQGSGKIWTEEQWILDENGDVTLFCYGLDEHPLTAFLSEAVNSLYIKVEYTKGDFRDPVKLEPIRFSHEKTYEIPGTPPPFSAEFKMGWYSYSVIGHFSDFMPNVAQVRNTYSWDGIDYQYVNRQWDLQYLGNQDPEVQNRLENQEIIPYYEEPMTSFLAGQQDSFYLRLEIITENNEVYYSQPVYLSRSERQPLPEHLTPRILLGFDLSVQEVGIGNGNAAHDEDYDPGIFTHGEYQLTVREDITPEEIMALLPDTVPVRVRLWDKNTKEKYNFADLDCQVKWKELPSFSLTPGEPFVIEDIAEPLVIPAGTDVVSALGTFTLKKPLAFKSRYDSDEIHLVLNPVTAEDEPMVAIKAYNLDLVDENGDDSNESRMDEPMSLAFWNKPSGATSIKAYYIVGDERTEICDLLDHRELNHNQSHALYGYIDLLQPDAYPYQAYLNGELEDFSVELEIEGGVYNGKEVTLPWPMEYEGPEEIFDPYGFDGQENNAGSGYEEIEEDTDNNGGMPPWFPPDGGNDRPQIKPEPPTQPGDGEQTLPPSVPEPPVLSGNEIDSMSPTPQEFIGMEALLPNPMLVGTQQQNDQEQQTEQETPSHPPLEGEQDIAALQPTPLPQEQITNPEEKASAKSGSLPLALKVVLVGVGAGAVVVIGGATIGTGQMGVGGKLLAVLEKLLHK